MVSLFRHHLILTSFGMVTRHLVNAKKAKLSALTDGRSERIRTSGPCLPKAVLYQAELHSDTYHGGWERKCSALAASVKFR